ncbi:unnamed protein product [Durusdinium trenchii]|uniref:Uncharacterized protein n=1 Tax=Durusdinium trenchii TaxID=1381693 RepID=A0ABP0Q8V9_9DINO
MQVAKPTQPTLLSRLEHIGTTKGTYSLYSLQSYESCWFPRSFRLQNPINFPSHVRPAQGHVQQISSTFEAFAALRSDGQVICWGDPFFGGNGDSSGVELTNIQLIQSTSWAFAALRSDGTVVTWGSANLGGVVSEQVQAQLVDVEGIESNGWAFVALRSDGSLVCWGDAESGGMVEEVWAQRELVDVVEVKGTERAFTAVRAATWRR